MSGEQDIDDDGGDTGDDGVPGLPGEVTEADEMAVFNEMAASRASGKSLVSATGLAPVVEASATAVEEKPVVETDGKPVVDPVLDSEGKPVTAAPVVEKPVVGADGKPVVEPVAEVVEAPAPVDLLAPLDLAGFLKDAGEMDVSPDDATEAEKSTVAKFAKDFPSVLKTQLALANVVDKRNAARAARFEPMFADWNRNRLLDAIEATGLEGARDLASNPGFSAWLGKQPAAVQALGQTGDVANNAKLLTLFRDDAKPAVRSAGERRAALEVVKAGGSGARRPASLAAAAPVASGAGEMSDDEADAEFARLAEERRKAGK